jgi:phage gp29-like protein
MDAMKPMEPEAPDMSEIARSEDPASPLRLDSLKAVEPYVTLLEATDTVLQSKGGIGNLSIYSELLRDDQVATTWGQRRLSLTSCDTVVEPGADDAASKAAAEALQAELDGMNWDDITDKALFAVFYGWGVAEVMWKPSTTPGLSVSFDRIVVRDRARFRFDRDGNVYLFASGSGWRQMPPRKFWRVVAGGDHHDQVYGLGLAHALYWPCFFKRNDIKFWLIFLEKFGMPTAIAKLSQAQLDDPETRRKALGMLRQIATDAGVAVPTDAQGLPIVELLEAARSGAADYQGLHDAMNSAIAKVVVGQTMTTDNGSSRAQAQVHLSVRQDIVEADADLLCSSFNQGPVLWWTEWNFPGATPPRVYRHTEPPEDLNARAERDGKIAALGYEPEEDYILKTYGEGWKKKQAPAMAPGMPGMPGLQQPGNADPAQFAEGEVAALQALRAARRGDQQALVEAAGHFAEQYDSIMGRQVGALLNAAEDAGDYDTFRERLTEILADGPSPEAMAKITRAGLFARMMGALRNQRRA